MSFCSHLRFYSIDIYSFWLSAKRNKCSSLEPSLNIDIMFKQTLTENHKVIWQNEHKKNILFKR